MITLMNLPYEFEDLEPYISEETLTFHYTKHHQGYVNNLNDLVQQVPLLNNKTVEEILALKDELPEEFKTPILNNAGQVYNHNMYWMSISSGAGSVPIGALAKNIVDSFGSYDDFVAEFTQKGMKQFGSGWVWLSVDAEGKLVIDSTSNADSPLLHGKTPIMTMDVWEHAYYLDYQNKRADYIANFFNLIDWVGVSERHDKAVK